MLTYSDVKPTGGKTILVAVHSSGVFSALQTVYICFPLKTAASYVMLEASCFCRCATRGKMAATAHKFRWPFSPFLVDSPLMPFICVVKRIRTKVAAEKMMGRAVVAGIG